MFDSSKSLTFFKNMPNIKQPFCTLYCLYCISHKKTEIIFSMKTILISLLALLLIIIPGFSWAQLVTVTGYVNNGTNGQAMENVNIFEANSGIGTITNQFGFYKLMLEKGTLNLSVSNDGFKPYSQKLEIVADTTLRVNLQPKLSIKSKEKKEQDLHADVKTDKKTKTSRGFKLF